MLISRSHSNKKNASECQIKQRKFNFLARYPVLPENNESGKIIIIVMLMDVKKKSFFYHPRMCVNNNNICSTSIEVS